MELNSQPQGALENGRTLTIDLVHRRIPEEPAGVRRRLGEAACGQGQYERATSMFEQMTAGEQFAGFLTLPAYERIR